MSIPPRARACNTRVTSPLSDGSRADGKRFIRNVGLRERSDSRRGMSSQRRRGDPPVRGQSDGPPEQVAQASDAAVIATCPHANAASEPEALSRRRAGPRPRPPARAARAGRRSTRRRASSAPTPRPRAAARAPSPTRALPARGTPRNATHATAHGTNCTQNCSGASRMRSQYARHRQRPVAKRDRASGRGRDAAATNCAITVRVRQRPRRRAPAR